MLGLVGNPEDRFSHNEAHIGPFNIYIVIGSPFAAYLADMDIYRLSSKAVTYEERPHDL